MRKPVLSTQKTATHEQLLCTAEGQATGVFNTQEINPFDRDLKSLAGILADKHLTDDQRRSELRSLKYLHSALREKDTDTCPTVKKMFASVPKSYWAYLFIYFNFEIIHLSFPYDQVLLDEARRAGRKLPKPRQETWLQSLDQWREVLKGTLSSIAGLGFKQRHESITADWALNSVQAALNKTYAHVPDFSDEVLKSFFLSDPYRNLIVFEHMEKEIIDNYKIAKWLPTDSQERVTFIADGFLSRDSFKIRSSVDLSKFFDIPYVRNQAELNALILYAVNHRDYHIVNYLDIFSWQDRVTIARCLQQSDPQGFIQLFGDALRQLTLEADLDESTRFNFVFMILRLALEANVDINSLVNDSLTQQRLVNLFSESKNLRETMLSNLNIVMRITANFIPATFYDTVTKVITEERTGHNGLFCFRGFFSAANQISLSPYKNYRDYLYANNLQMPFVNFVCSNFNEYIYGHMLVHDYEAAAQLITDFCELLLKQLASEIKFREYLKNDDEHTQAHWLRCLDNLVHIYGPNKVVTICRSLDLQKQCQYVNERYTHFPNILTQTDTIVEHYKMLLQNLWEKKNASKNQDPHLRMSVLSSRDCLSPPWNEIHLFIERFGKILIQQGIVCTDEIIDSHAMFRLAKRAFKEAGLSDDFDYLLESFNSAGFAISKGGGVICKRPKHNLHRPRSLRREFNEITKLYNHNADKSVLAHRLNNFVFWKRRKALHGDSQSKEAMRMLNALFVGCQR